MRVLMVMVALVAPHVYARDVLAQEGSLMRFIPEDRLNGRVRAFRLEKYQTFQTVGNHDESRSTLRQEVTYDLRGRRSTEINYNVDGTISTKLVFRHDSDGDLTEVGEYKANGIFLRKKVYTREGNSIEEISYQADGTPSAERVIRTYDDGGRQVGIVTSSATTSSSVRAIITYKDGGKTVEVAMCVSNTNAPVLASGSVGGMVVLSDSMKEQMKSVAPCVDGLLTSRTVFTLDDTGNISETAIYTHDNTLIGKERYSREYDSQGNWIKEIRLKWNPALNKYESIETTNRTITYF